MTDEPDNAMTSGGSPGLAAEREPAFPPPPEGASGDLRAVGAQLDRIERQIGATHDSTQALVRSMLRIEERMEHLERTVGINQPPATQQAAPVPAAPAGGLVVSDEVSLVAAQLAQLERRLVEVDDRAAQEILDAIVAVAQHLEAVQTATAWAIVREMRSG